MMKLQLDNVIKIKSEPLDSDSCLLSTLINISDQIHIEKFTMELQRVNEIILFDLSDIFMYNYINVPSLDNNRFMRYNTTSCLDLKPFIKAISWKNSSLIVTKENHILDILANIILKMERNKNEFYYQHEDSVTEVSNICGDIGVGIKVDVDKKRERFFGLFDDKFFFGNTGQMSETNKTEALNRIDIILGALNEQ